MNQPSELISRRRLFSNPERRLVRISPDGTRIAFQAPLDGVLNVWIAPLDNVDEARPVTAVTDRNIAGWHLWTHDNSYIIYARDQAGDENWQIWRVDLKTGESKALTPGPGVNSYVQHRSSHFPGELLIAHNARDKRYFDIYRIDVASGNANLLHLNEGFGRFFTDNEFQVRLAVRKTENGETEYLQRGEFGDWQRFELIEAADILTTYPIEYRSDGRELYWLDSRGRNTAAVVAQDLNNGQCRVLAEDPRSDHVSVALDPITQRPLAAARLFERTEWQALDPDFQEVLTSLTQGSHGDLSLLRFSQDRRHILYAYQYDDAPPEYFHYDRAAKRQRRLFGSMPCLEGAPLVSMKPLTVRSRDGLDLPCYLSLPNGAERGTRLPMVLLVHGGPWNRDVWGLSSSHQWLANRGYAVLSVNFRGSTGFGKAFINAANLEWAGKMHDDLIDGVDWAIAEDIADPSKIAIMGGSYGGYAALVGLTFTPEKFACAIDLVGISNLVTFINTIPEYWKPWKSLWKTRMGDFDTPEGLQLLQERSPLNKADRIVRPLLIAQGANDVRVKSSESDQIVAAMQAHRIPVTYLSYPDEGHGLTRPENRRSFAAVAEAFLAAHLGGRFEPVGDDFEGSTLEFKAGHDLIPGLNVNPAANREVAPHI